MKTSEGSSESLSPPSLQPLPELNSDYEENVEEPPDLEIYSIGNGNVLKIVKRKWLCYLRLSFSDCEDASFLTNLSEYDAIKTDHIGSVADILGPDFLPDGPVPNEAERSEASSKAEIVEVDGQTILSFASAEELEEYVSHSEPTHQLAKTNDNTIENIVKLCQPTPSLTPSPCTSPFPSSQINLPADSAAAAADVSSDTNRRSPIPSLSEDSTLPDQEICSIMEGDSVKRNAAETSRDVEESKPGNETGGEEQNSDNERAEDHSNVLRYSESDDSITDAVEAQLGEERVTVKIESDCFCDDNVKGSPPESSPGKALPELKTDGTITPEVAAFAVSAITLSPQPAPAITLPKPASIAPKKPNGPGRGRRSGSVSSINRPGRRSEPSIFDKSAPSDEADEILNVDMAVNETAFENLVVHDEEYTEEYGIHINTCFLIVYFMALNF